MEVERSVLDDNQKALIERIDAEMSALQSRLDRFDDEMQDAMRVVNELKRKILPVKAELSPLAALKAAIASKRSRAKYFSSDDEYKARLDLV